MTTEIRVLERPENESDWTVTVNGSEQRVDGWASLRELMAKYPDAEHRVAGVLESAMRKADIERAMANFKSNGGTQWVSNA